VSVLYLHQERPDREPMKFRPWAPNLQVLQDFCRGTCQTWTSASPVRLGEPLPRRVVDEMELGVRRAVDGVAHFSVRALPDRWLVQFDALDGNDAYAYAFAVEARWACLERTHVGRA